MRGFVVVGVAFSLSACGGSPPPRGHEQPTLLPVAPPMIHPIASPREDGRLPANATPTRYALDLTIDPAQATFSGRARIAVTLAQRSRLVLLHGRDLTVRSVSAATPARTVAGRARPREGDGGTEGNDELVLELDGELPAGEAELAITYEAPFAAMRGLFRSEEGGEHFAFTHFEPSDARRMFPCFDEPAYKTPFQLTVHVPKGSLAFANTAETRRSDDASTGLTTFEFEPSLPLPTYVVALAVGPFEVLEGQKVPVPIRVLAGKGKATLGKTALEVAAAHVDLFGKYFDQPYPYGKLDLVAVPNFHAGAMENAGLVTVREDLLLVDDAGGSMNARRQLADAIGHELAHHWFGNLVTMRWWDELWLKESFAQWIGAKVADQWRPETKAVLSQVSQKSWAMQLDALPGARPLKNPADSAREVNDGYNTLIFGKGAPIIGMVEAWLGEGAFRDGVRRYMKKHRGGSVTSQDLYAALAESAGGRDVGHVVDTFVRQTGVPVVSVELDCGGAKRGGGKVGSSAPIVRVRQEEYRYLDRREPSQKTWRVPVCIKHDAGGAPGTRCAVLDGDEGRIELASAKAGAPACPSFVYPNANEAGYYRFRLSRADLEKLVRRGLGKLAESERLGLLGNAWAAVWSGHLPLSGYFELLRSYRNESSALVLGEMVGTLSEIDKAVVTDATRPLFARLVREVLGPAGRRLGWAPKQGEPEEAKRARHPVLFAMGLLGQDAALLAEARRRARAWLADPAKVDPDLARLAITLAAEHGDTAMFDALLEVHRNADKPEVRQLAKKGLTAFDDPALVERALDLTLDGTLKTQDTHEVLLAYLRRPKTVEAAHAWVEKHFDEVVKASPYVPLTIARTPLALCNAERVRAVESFLRPRLEKTGGAKDLDEYVHVGLRCAALAEKEAGPTKSWLARAGR